MIELNTYINIFRRQKMKGKKFKKIMHKLIYLNEFIKKYELKIKNI